MDTQIRAEHEHVHEDPNKLYYISFYLEKEGAGTPIHGLMHLLRHRRVQTEKVESFFDQVREAFVDYLDETQGHTLTNTTTYFSFIIYFRPKFHSKPECPDL